MGEGGRTIGKSERAKIWRGKVITKERKNLGPRPEIKKGVFAGKGGGGGETRFFGKKKGACSHRKKCKNLKWENLEQ